MELRRLVALEDTIDDIISACLTHDLLEDTGVSPVELERETSRRTTEIVLSLTKPLAEANSSRQQRNDRLLRQIVTAAQTAMFVKICDYLHNISRPDQTPVYLLEKAIRKGRNSYLELFDHGRLPDELKAEFLARLERAESYKRALVDPNSARPTVEGLAQAISYCVATADRKVLERHDILEIIEVVFGSDLVRGMSLDEFLVHVLLSEQGANAQKIRSRAAKSAEKGEIRVSEFKDAELREGCVGLHRVLALPLSRPDDLRVARNDFIFVGIREERSREWANPDSLRVIYTYLSERMRLQEKKSAGDLEMEMADLGLSLDLREVQKLQLNHLDMGRLRALLDYADFARNVLTRAIEFELADRKNVGEIVIVESRVKSPRSIVSKMLARRCREFSEIDDVVGVRVVCASLAETRRVAQRIERATQSLKVFKSQKVGNIERDERASITSVAGYKAMHMYLACPPRSPGEPSLGCEIQIRSIFQDAWARLSQHLSYKKSRLSAQVVREALSELAELRDKVDSIVDKIASR